jgi:hypothetical protein
MEPQHKEYLKSTQIMDSDNREIVNYARDAIKDAGEDPISKAVKLYYAVRDDIWYDPYSPFYLPEHYRASNVLKRGRGYCVGKASLLCTLGRFCGIPSRVGYADVRNHLATRQLIEYLGTDLFVYHGYVEFYLALEFNGREDSLFQPYSTENKQFMEYIVDHGAYADIPVDIIVAGWEKAYGKDRVRQWIEKFENTGGRSKRNFYKEDVWKA